MAVETRYVVIRNKKEMKIFATKQEADAYDKLLESVELLNQLLSHCPLELSDEQRDSLSLYLAQEKDSVLQAFGLNSVRKAKTKASKEKMAAE